jgi:hypothetical protein
MTAESFEQIQDEVNECWKWLQRDGLENDSQAEAWHVDPSRPVPDDIRLHPDREQVVLDDETLTVGGAGIQGNGKKSRLPPAGSGSQARAAKYPCASSCEPAEFARKRIRSTRDARSRIWIVVPLPLAEISVPSGPPM